MDWLLRRLADRLGVEPARAGEAITPQIRFEQPWSQGLTLLVVLGCAALVIWLYRREGSASLLAKMFLAGLRIALVVLAVFMLSEAVLSVDRTGLPYFVILVDDSASGRVVDQPADPKIKAAAVALAEAGGGGEADRIHVARGLLLERDTNLIRALQKQHKVLIYLASSKARKLIEVDSPAQVNAAAEAIRQVQAEGAQSRLGPAVREVLTELRGVPPTAILLLSDGQATDGEPLAQAAEFAARKGVPIFAVGLGDPDPARDLELSELLVDEVAFVDDLVTFQAKLGGKGFAGEQVTVTLKERPIGSTDPKDDRPVETTKVAVPSDGQVARVELGHRPRKTGEVTYTIEVETRPRELQADNNRIVRTISVREEKLKVLFADGEPRYEYRYLKDFLEREKTIDLGVVLLSSDPEYSEQDRSALPTFPASKEDLFAYDVVILGDVDPGFLSTTQMANLAEFVAEKGGGLMMIAGEHFNPIAYRGTPLEPLVPVELAEARNPSAVGNAVQSFRPELTAEGRSSPIFRFGDDEATSAAIWKGLPELTWFLEAPRKKPAALVLAEHPSLSGSDGKLPIMLYQYVGSGKTMLNTADDTWRWRYRVANRYFGRFWLQTVRFLARSKLLGQKQAEVTTDRRRYRRDQPVLLRVRFPNPALAPTVGEVTVQVQAKGRGPRKLALKASPGSRNVFEGALPRAVEGDYEVRLLPPPVLSGSIPTATFQVEPPAGEFEQIAMNRPELVRAATATGGKFYIPGGTSKLLEDLPKPQKVPLDTDPPIPLWNTWPVLALFLTILVTEWVVRKRKQMV